MKTLLLKILVALAMTGHAQGGAILNAKAKFLNDTVGASNTAVEFSGVLSTQVPSGGHVRIVLPHWNPLGSVKLHYVTTASPLCQDLFTKTLPVTVKCFYSEFTRELLITDLPQLDANSTIRFRVDSFRAPYNGIPREGILLETRTQTGHSFDSATNVVFKVSTPGILSSVALKTDRATLNTLVSFKLSYSHSIPLDAHCRLKITAPTQFDLSQGLVSISGSNTFKSAAFKFDGVQTITVDGCDRNFEATNNFDTLILSKIKTNGAVMDSKPFVVQLIAVEGPYEHVVASDNVRAFIHGSDLTPGWVTGATISADQTTVQDITSAKISFSLTNALTEQNVLRIQFPKPDKLFGFTDTPFCSLSTPLQNAVAQPTSCQIFDNQIVIRNVQGDYKALPVQSTITFSISGLTNSVSTILDVGEFQFQTFLVSETGAEYLIDSGKFSGLYKPTVGEIKYGLEVTVDNYTTYANPAAYTVKFQTKRLLPRGALILVTIPLEDIGVVDVQLLQVQVALGEGNFISRQFTYSNGLITLQDAFAIGDFDPSVEKDATVRIKIKNLRSPISTEPTSSFKVQTLDANYNLIAFTDTGLSVTMRDGMQLNSVQVQPKSIINGELTNYQVLINSKAPLDTNSKFQIWFPPEILFKGTIACNPIAQVVQAVTCKRSDRSVTVQFTFKQQKIDGGTVFGFEIVDVYNPSSTKPTSPYSMILLRDENDFILSQYTAKTVTTQSIQPGLLKSASLSMSSRVSEEKATFTFQFTTQNPVDKDGSIQVRYTSNVDFGQVSKPEDCQVVDVSLQNRFYMTCVFDRIARTVTLKGSQNLLLRAGAQVQVILSPFINPIKAVDESFEISTFSDQAQLYIIDRVSQGLKIEENCVSDCKTCVNLKFHDQCTSCWDDNRTDKKYLQGVDCQAICDNGFYQFNGVLKTCEVCHSDCSSCRDYSVCISCKKDSDRPYYLNNQCLQECPAGFYADNQNICKPCQFPCHTCTGPENGQCLSCDISSAQKLLTNEGKCVFECSAGYFANQLSCVDCDPLCSTCTGQADQCLSCKASTFLLGTQCVSECPQPNYLQNPATRKCEGCDPKCKECVGQQTKICVECQIGFIQFDGACFVSCPTDFFPDPATGKFCTKEPINFVALQCDKLSNDFFKSPEQGYLIWFPMLWVTAIVMIIVLGSYCYDKKTRVSASMIALLGPVELIALFIQAIIAAKTEGIRSFECYEDRNPQTRQPIVFIVTISVIILLYILNFVSLIVLKKSRRINSDTDFSSWKARQPKWTLIIVAIFQAGINFKCMSILYSYFLGRKRYAVTFKNPKPFFRLVKALSILFMLAGSVTLICINIATLSGKKWGTQMFISLIDVLIIETIFCVLHIVDMIQIKHLINDPDGSKRRAAVMAGLEEEKLVKSQKEEKLEEIRRAAERERLLTVALQAAGPDAVRAYYEMIANEEKERIKAAKRKRQLEQVMAGLPDEEESLCTEAREAREAELLLKAEQEELQRQEDERLRLVEEARLKHEAWVANVKAFCDMLRKNIELREVVNEVLGMGELSSEEQDRYKQQNLVKAPFKVEDRTFNENDIIGNLYFDSVTRKPRLAKRNKMPSWFDTKAQKVTTRGYLFNSHGDLVNKKGQIVFKNHQLTETGDFPPVFSIERYNFSAKDVLGNFNAPWDVEQKEIATGGYVLSDNKPEEPIVVEEGVEKLRDNDGYVVNLHGFLVDESGDVVDRKERKLIKSFYLGPNGDFPILYNLDGNKFQIKEVFGDFKRADFEEWKGFKLVFTKKTLPGESVERLFDLKDRLVNSRGYLIDNEGNIITSSGRIAFHKKFVNAQGEFPKFFSFTIFDEDNVRGDFEMGALGRPMLYCSHTIHKVLDVRTLQMSQSKFGFREFQLPVVCMPDQACSKRMDKKGRLCNKEGYLVDSEGNLIDTRKRLVMPKSFLVDELTLPRLFKKEHKLFRSNSRCNFDVIAGTETWVDFEQLASQATDKKSRPKSATSVEKTPKEEKTPQKKTSPIKKRRKRSKKKSPAKNSVSIEKDLDIQINNIFTMPAKTGQAENDVQNESNDSSLQSRKTRQSNKSDKPEKEMYETDHSCDEPITSPVVLSPAEILEEHLQKPTTPGFTQDAPFKVDQDDEEPALMPSQTDDLSLEAARGIAILAHQNLLFTGPATASSEDEGAEDFERNINSQKRGKNLRLRVSKKSSARIKKMELEYSQTLKKPSNMKILVQKTEDKSKIPSPSPSKISPSPRKNSLLVSLAASQSLEQQRDAFESARKKRQEQRQLEMAEIVKQVDSIKEKNNDLDVEENRI